MAVTRTAGAVFFGSLSGYAFAKLRFFGRETIFWTLMAVLMLPSFILIIPQYQIIQALGIYDTFWALIDEVLNAVLFVLLGLVVLALNLSGVLTVHEALAGFADPVVMLIAAVAIIGEGLVATGVAYRLVH